MQVVLQIKKTAMIDKEQSNPIKPKQKIISYKN